jgi:selenocysteine lyase/cysteine desulfurase
MTTTADLRARFDVPREVCWLNAAYLTPLPNRTVEAGLAAVRRKQHPWSIRPADFHPEVDQAKRLFATLIDGSSDCVAITPASSYGIATIAANLPVGPGRKVVVPALEHTSAHHAWVRAARQGGGRVEVVARAPGQAWGAAIAAAIDRTTEIVSVPPNHWSDGARFDLGRIAQACRDNGAKLVIDGTQAIGAMPFSVRAYDPDFVVCSAYKWLLGPYTLAFFYAAPRWHGIEPLELHPFSRVGARGAEGRLEPLEELVPDAARFDMGERSNFVLLPMAIASLESLLEIGVSEIRDHCDAISRRIAEGAARFGYQATPDRVPHMMGLRHPRRLDLVDGRRLQASGIHISVRGDALRISPHVYNDDDDADRLIASLGDLLAQAA